MHSLSVAPEPFAGFFYPKRTWIQVLGMFSGGLLLLDVVVWWWLIVNVVCSQVVQYWYFLPNMLVLEYCCFTPDSSFIEFCLFTVSFVRFVPLVLPVHVHRFFWPINILLMCCFDSSSILLRGLKSP